MCVNFFSMARGRPISDRGSCRAFSPVRSSFLDFETYRIGDMIYFLWHRMTHVAMLPTRGSAYVSCCFTSNCMKDVYTYMCCSCAGVEQWLANSPFFSPKLANDEIYSFNGWVNLERRVRSFYHPASNGEHLFSNAIIFTVYITIWIWMYYFKQRLTLKVMKKRDKWICLVWSWFLFYLHLILQFFNH